jgi:hypothetical protein
MLENGIGNSLTINGNGEDVLPVKHIYDYGRQKDSKMRDCVGSMKKVVLYPLFQYVTGCYVFSYTSKCTISALGYRVSLM